jgi:hypothetical protein
MHRSTCSRKKALLRLRGCTRSQEPFGSERRAAVGSRYCRSDKTLLRWRFDGSGHTKASGRDLKGCPKERLTASFKSTSEVALANVDVIRPKKTIARNMRRSYQIESIDSKYPPENINTVRFLCLPEVHGRFSFPFIRLLTVA